MYDKANGVLKINKNGNGILRNVKHSFLPQVDDIFVSPYLIHEFKLVEGATITGYMEKDKNKLKSIETICNLKPSEYLQRVPFTKLTAINPCERFNLAKSGDKSMRIIDLVAPIGKGTRGLIVSPSKSGKTTILEQIAKSIQMIDPKIRIIALLIDERPEEVTHFKRSVDAEVLASSSDHSVKEHIELSNLALAHIRTELECGKDIVVLVDSLTRMGRAFNAKGSGTRRTLSGGVEAGALEIPRRFFGLARNIENGGSVTIIATILVNTGSRMDQLIFEEFKGTGNSEIVLDRSLADTRVFPAIDIKASGTRKEEKLYTENQITKINLLRRELINKDPKEAIILLLKMMNRFTTNEELLDKLYSK